MAFLATAMWLSRFLFADVVDDRLQDGSLDQAALALVGVVVVAAAAAAAPYPKESGKSSSGCSSTREGEGGPLCPDDTKAMAAAASMRRSLSLSMCVNFSLSPFRI